MVQATVKGFDGGTMRVTIDRRGCAACLEGRGCGMGLIAAGRDQFRELDVAAPSPRPEIGSVIELASEHPLVPAAALAYGLPLSGLLLGASVGQWLLSDSGAAVLAVAGMLLAGVLARRFARGRFEPRDCASVVRRT